MQRKCCSYNQASLLPLRQHLRHTGFVVADSYIGGGANQIGMNLSSWQGCYRCGAVPGTCTAVRGGSPYDQFSSFRSSSLAGLLANAGSNCSWLSNSVMAFGSVRYPVQQVACDYSAGFLNVTLQLNASAFGVIPTLSTLSVAGTGQSAWAPGSSTGKPSPPRTPSLAHWHLYTLQCCLNLFVLLSAHSLLYS